MELKREIHVTVGPDQRAALSALLTERWPEAKLHCFQNLPVGSGRPYLDVMSGHLVEGSLERAMSLSTSIHDSMVRRGIVPLRVKIEVEAAQYPESDDVGYYESHARLVGAWEWERVPSDLARARILLSRSTRSMDWYATFRSTGCSLERHVNRVNRATRMLFAHRVQVAGAVRHEYVEVDSRRSLDDQWEKTDGS